jgi:hypothetical protein
MLAGGQLMARVPATDLAGNVLSVTKFDHAAPDSHV